MDRQDLQVLDAVRRWSAAGHSFVLVTLARTWGLAPRSPGAWLALRDDGLVQGSVSGGCVEADLVERIRSGRLGGPAPTKVAYGVTSEESTRFGLPCGGTLELVIEARPDVAQLIRVRLWPEVTSGHWPTSAAEQQVSGALLSDMERGLTLGIGRIAVHVVRRKLRLISA